MPVSISVCVTTGVSRPTASAATQRNDVNDGPARNGVLAGDFGQVYRSGPGADRPIGNNFPTGAGGRARRAAENKSPTGTGG